jgi:hypothetical protein
MELEYKLHYASRLYSWNNDESAHQKLMDIKNAVMPTDHEQRVANLEHIRAELAIKDFERDVNNYVARKPYFEKYPDLLLVHNALFRIRHWYCIYDIDERPALFQMVPKQQVEAMIDSLQNDKDAMRVLSTYAINLIYLYEKLYADEKDIVDMQAILGLKAGYDYANKVDLQMLIYLYTHCILGETLFYWQAITKRANDYMQMMRELEKIIVDNYEDVNLDNKFEFLVCARICGFSSELQAKIYDEAERSLGPEGFIVDTLNKNGSPVKQSFLMSEHRNVLYIMSLTDPVFNAAAGRQ